MKGDAESTLNLVASNYPKLSDLVDQIRIYLTSKLYHELTGAINELLADDHVSCDVKLQVFESLVHPLKDSINCLRFCELLKLSSDNLEPKVALEHLTKYDGLLERNLEAFLMLQIAKSYHHVKNGQTKECGQLLDVVREKVAACINLDISVHSAYNHASAFMNKADKNYSQCYKDLIMYLNYTSINDIPESQREQVAVDLTISAIIAPDCFGFGELIHQPIIECYLRGKSQNWLYDLLHIFNEGQLKPFEDLLVRLKGKFVHSELQGHSKQMHQKLTLIAFLNLVFRKPNKQRSVTFKEIVVECGVGAKEVEPFILQAFARGLIRGYVDQVEELVYVSWIQPRILDNSKLQVLNKRIKDWAMHIHEFTNKLQEQIENAAV